MRRFFLVLLFLLIPSGAFAATCSVTGTVTDAGGATINNAVLMFNSLRTQIVSGVSVPQSIVTGRTDGSGNLTGLTIVQGLYGEITIALPNGGGVLGAPVSVFVPNISSVTFGALMAGSLGGGSNGVAEYAFGVTGLLGGLTSTAAATLKQGCTTAVNAGHFTMLTLTTELNAGACTTAPTYNIRDNTAATTGTAKAAGTTAGVVTQAESLAFSAGDVICLVRTVNGGTCTTPVFNVTAQVTVP